MTDTSSSQNNDVDTGRIHQRDTYEKWVLVYVIDPQTGEVATQMQSPGSDISKGGLGIMSAAEIPMGSLVVIRMQLRNQDVWMSGAVRWTKFEESSRWHRIGIRYEPLPADLQGRVESWIADMSSMLPAADVTPKKHSKLSVSKILAPDGDLRSNTRMDKDGWVYAFIIDAKQDIVMTQFLSPAHDVSGTGIGLESALPMPEDSAVVIAMPEDNELLWHTGTIRWCRQEDGCNKYRIGVEFTEEHQQYLERHVEELHGMLPQSIASSLTNKKRVA